MPKRSTSMVRGLALICTAQFVLQVDFSIVNVALPSIQRELHFSAPTLQWVVTGYALTFGSLLLVGGRLADLVGRRRLLIGGLTLFALASIAAGLAQSELNLILMRFLQGAAGALISPAALSMLTSMTSEGETRSRALSIWQAATAAGATAGILAGGILVQLLGWRAVFLANPPVIAVLCALAPRWLPDAPPQRGQRLDAAGASLATLALAALIFAVSQVQTRGFFSLACLVPLGIAVLAGGVFVAVEQIVGQPMLPRRVLQSRTRAAACIAMVCLGGVQGGWVYFVSLYLQRVHHVSPLLTGVSLTPSSVTIIVTSTFLSRRLIAKFPVKWLLAFGLILIALAQLWLSRIGVGHTFLIVIVPAEIVTALGFAIVAPTASVAVTSGVAKDEQGVAGALFTTSQQVGAAVGLAVLATLAAAMSAHSTAGTSHLAPAVQGYRLAFTVSAGIAAAATLVVIAAINAKTCDEQADQVGLRRRGPAVILEAEARLRRV